MEPLNAPAESRVVALPDDDGDGRADRTVVLAEDLDRPSSLAWRPGTDQLRIGHAGGDFRHDLRQRARNRDRRHCPADDEGRDDRGLHIGCVNFQRSHHRRIESQR